MYRGAAARPPKRHAPRPQRPDRADAGLAPCGSHTGLAEKSEGRRGFPPRPPLFGHKPNSVPPRLLKATRRRSFISRRGFSPAEGVLRRACDRYPGWAPNLRPAPDRRPGIPVWPCTAWGLSCPGSHPPGGGLLPRLFTLALAPVQARHGGLFSVTLSIDRGLRHDPPRIFRGMLPYGVRTFLSGRNRSDHLPAANLRSKVETKRKKGWAEIRPFFLSTFSF